MDYYTLSVSIMCCLTDQLFQELWRILKEDFHALLF